MAKPGTLLQYSYKNIFVPELQFSVIAAFYPQNHNILHILLPCLEKASAKSISLLHNNDQKLLHNPGGTVQLLFDVQILLEPSLLFSLCDIQNTGIKPL